MSMRWMKWFTGFLLTLIVVFSLGACGSSLEKPTGLEDTDHQQAETHNQEKDDKELNEKSVNDEEQETTNDVEAETSKEEAESDENENGSKTDSVSENKNKSNPDSKTTNKKTASNDNKSSKKSSPDSNRKKKDKSVKKSNKSTSDSSKNKPKNEKKKDKPKPDPESKKDTIIHSIVISEESNEVPLPPTEMEIKNGDTVLEALIAITMENKIHMDYRGGQGATAYVQGMGNVYEFDRGQGSGWMYRINGIFPDRGAGVVPLCDGDRVEWLYTTNLGEDLGADLKPIRRNGKCSK